MASGLLQQCVGPRRTAPAAAPPTRAPAALEVCVDGVDAAVAAAAGGATRLELCSGLAEGGLTPSSGLIQAVRGAAPGVPLHVLVHPRGGDFLYSAAERQVMAADVEAAAALGAAGVALGLLTADGEVDAAHLVPLAALCRSRGLDLTFHRAFDCARDPSEALEQLVACGVPRVLTSGGHASALEGADALAALVAQAAGRIAVMAGGGVRPGNAAALLARAGVRELHTSARRVVPSGMRRRPGVPLCAPALLHELDHGGVDAAAVVELRAACAACERGGRPHGLQTAWRLLTFRAPR